MNTSLRFIFSHSALKEGWDNPNVFQICTLVDTNDTITKRQKIGRGLRIPVNQDLVRNTDSTLNVLTVVANESYEEFAEQLQKEMEEDSGVKFGIIEERSFEDVLRKDTETGEMQPLGYDTSKVIYDHLKSNEYISDNGKIQQSLREDIVAGSLSIPEEFEDVRTPIENIIRKSTKRLPIQKKENGVPVRAKQQVLLTEEFKELWSKIQQKTTYRLNFSQDEFSAAATENIKNMPAVKTLSVVSELVDLQIQRQGITTTEPRRRRKLARTAREDKRPLPDILEHIERYTGITKRSIVKILTDSDRLDDFYNNEHEFLQQVVEIINKTKRTMIIDGISYFKKHGEVYSQELFESEDIIAYLNHNAIPADRSVFDHVVYDSGVEKEFALALEQDEDVLMYLKLPRWFKVDTPLGAYNPDWALVLNENGQEKLYFIVETKGSILAEALRKTEEAKITCGKKHFESLGVGIKFDTASDYKQWRNAI